MIVSIKNDSITGFTLFNPVLKILPAGVKGKFVLTEPILARIKENFNVLMNSDELAVLSECLSLKSTIELQLKFTIDSQSFFNQLLNDTFSPFKLLRQLECASLSVDNRITLQLILCHCFCFGVKCRPCTVAAFRLFEQIQFHSLQKLSPLQLSYLECLRGIFGHETKELTPKVTPIQSKLVHTNDQLHNDINNNEVEVVVDHVDSTDHDVIMTLIQSNEIDPDQKIKLLLSIGLYKEAQATAVQFNSPLYYTSERCIDFKKKSSSGILNSSDAKNVLNDTINQCIESSFHKFQSRKDEVFQSFPNDFKTILASFESLHLIDPFDATTSFLLALCLIVNDQFDRAFTIFGQLCTSFSIVNDLYIIEESIKFLKLSSIAHKLPLQTLRKYFFSITSTSRRKHPLLFKLLDDVFGVDDVLLPSFDFESSIKNRGLNGATHEDLSQLGVSALLWLKFNVDASVPFPSLPNDFKPSTVVINSLFRCLNTLAFTSIGTSAVNMCHFVRKLLLDLYIPLCQEIDFEIVQDWGLSAIHCLDLQSIYSLSSGLFQSGPSVEVLKNVLLLAADVLTNRISLKDFKYRRSKLRSYLQSPHLVTEGASTEKSGRVLRCFVQVLVVVLKLPQSSDKLMSVCQKSDMFCSDFGKNLLFKGDQL
ncbi:hypothetical protein GEMRC1_004534 [Eukaryota sp. GEM-RC1]